LTGEMCSLGLSGKSSTYNAIELRGREATAGAD